MYRSTPVSRTAAQFPKVEPSNYNLFYKRCIDCDGFLTKINGRWFCPRCKIFWDKSDK